MNVGKAIVILRNSKNISQNKLSKLTDLNRGYLYRLENNQISPSVSTLETIAEAINVKVSDIIILSESSNSI